MNRDHNPGPAEEGIPTAANIRRVAIAITAILVGAALLVLAAVATAIIVVFNTI